MIENIRGGEKQWVVNYRRSDAIRDGSRTDPGRATLKLVRSDRARVSMEATYQKHLIAIESTHGDGKKTYQALYQT